MTSRTSRLLLVTLSCFLLLSTALARSAAADPGWASSTVEKVRVDRNGKGIVYFTANLTYGTGGRPVCVNTAGTYDNALAFDTNTAGGMAILKLVLAAKLSGTPVQAKGTGTCTIYGNNVMEDWSYGYIN